MAGLSPFEQMIAAQREAEASGSDDQSILWKALGYLNRPASAEMGGLSALIRGQDAGQAAWQGFTGAKQFSGRDVLEALGAPPDSGWTTAGGIAADILNPADPLLYVGGLGGLTKAGKAAARVGDIGAKLGEAGITAKMPEMLAPLAKDWGQATQQGQRALLSFAGHRLPIPGDYLATGALQDVGNKFMGSRVGQGITELFGKEAARLQLRIDQDIQGKTFGNIVQGSIDARKSMLAALGEVARPKLDLVDALKPDESKSLSQLWDLRSSGQIDTATYWQRLGSEGNAKSIARKTEAAKALDELTKLKADYGVSHELATSQFQPYAQGGHLPQIAEYGKGLDEKSVSQYAEKYTIPNDYGIHPNTQYDNAFNQALIPGEARGILSTNLSDAAQEELIAKGKATGKSASTPEGWMKHGRESMTNEQYAEFLNRPNARLTAEAMNALAATGARPISYMEDIAARANAGMSMTHQAIAAEAEIDFLKKSGIAKDFDAATHLDNPDFIIVNQAKYANAPLAIPKEFADFAGRVMRGMTPGPGNAMLGGMAQEAYSWMKAMQLYGLPFVPIRIQFPFRNAVNGMWKNWIEGVPLYRQAAYAPDAAKFATLMHKAPEEQEKAWFTLPQSGVKVNGRTLVEQYNARGMGGMSTISPELFSRLVEGDQIAKLGAMHEKPSEMVLASRQAREEWYRRHYKMNEWVESGPIRFPLMMHTMDNTFADAIKAGFKIEDINTRLATGIESLAPNATASIPAPLASLAPTPTPTAAPSAVPFGVTGLTQNFSALGAGMGAALRNQMWDSYQKGLTAVAGIEEPVLHAAKRLQDAGFVKDRAGFDALVNDFAQNISAKNLNSGPQYQQAMRDLLNRHAGATSVVPAPTAPPIPPAAMPHPTPTPSPGTPVPSVIEGVHPTRMTQDLWFQRAMENAEGAVKRAHFDYCVDLQTEVLTQRGWLSFSQVVVGDMALGIDPVTREIRWTPVDAVNVFPYEGNLYEFKSTRFCAVSTPNHRWLCEGSGQRGGHWTKRSSQPKEHFATTESLVAGIKKSIIVGGGNPTGPGRTIENPFVELVGWYLTEGWDSDSEYGIMVAQSQRHNQNYVDRIEDIAYYYRKLGCTATHYKARDYGHGPISTFYFGKGIGEEIRAACPGKQLTVDFLNRLDKYQLKLLFDTMMAADGHTIASSRIFSQKDWGRTGGFQTLCSMLGLRTTARWNGKVWCTTVYYHSDRVHASVLKKTEIPYDGKVWCPTTGTGTWMARRNGCTFWTGNSDLSPFEKRYLRGFWVPFYSWYRNNIPHEVQNMLTQPGKYIPVVKGYYQSLASQGMTPEDIPNFLRDTLTIPVGTDENGNPTVVNFSSWLPSMDVAEMAAAMNPVNKPLGRDWPSRLIGYGATKSNPFVQTVAELGLGKDFLSGRDIRQDRPAEVLGIGPVGQKTKLGIENMLPPVQQLDILNPAIPGVAPQGIFTRLGQALGSVPESGQRPARNEAPETMRYLRMITGVRPFTVDERKELDMTTRQKKKLSRDYQGAEKRARMQGDAPTAEWYHKLAEQLRGGG